MSSQGRNRSNSPKNAKDVALLTMTTFPKKYVQEMKQLRTYQRTMDKRLSQPRYRRVVLRQATHTKAGSGLCVNVALRKK